MTQMTTTYPLSVDVFDNLFDSILEDVPDMESNNAFLVITRAIQDQFNAI